eukprot:10152715-Karenia_brevis.AAC.1
MLGSTDDFVVGCCTTNKVAHKRSGSRDGFVFLIPRQGVTGIDLGAPILKFWELIKGKFGDEVLGLFRDFGPGANLRDAECFFKQPLAYPKLGHAMAQILTMPPY